jgi:hypothetical protein
MWTSLYFSEKVKCVKQRKAVCVYASASLGVDLSCCAHLEQNIRTERWPRARGCFGFSAQSWIGQIRSRKATSCLSRARHYKQTGLVIHRRRARTLNLKHFAHTPKRRVHYSSSLSERAPREAKELAENKIHAASRSQISTVPGRAAPPWVTPGSPPVGSSARTKIAPPCYF